MKLLLILLLSLCVPFLSVAQQSNSIEIDPSSFAPVQKSVIEGVAIDKIQPDLSRRPCARIKLHINRMSREDIASLSVKTVGGNIVVMKNQVASEGNGLIIELTAKEQTRFYLHHDIYGDSNEVMLNLEGDKEYKLEAELSLLQSIVVSTNIAGAEVYVDNDFKGRTGDDMALTVNDMTHGIHNLRVVYGVAKSERQIEVSGSNIHFRIDVDSSVSRPQYVIFEVNPKNAVVTINSTDYIPDQYGMVQIALNNGTYSYSVAAKDYHEENGNFVVKGEKVDKSVVLKPAYGWLNISETNELRGASVFVDEDIIGNVPIKKHKLKSGTHKIRIVKKLYKSFEAEFAISDNSVLEYKPKLVADFAKITLTVKDDSDIYVNNEYMGTSSWSGNLASGTYIFEAHKKGHRTTSISKTISASTVEQTYEIPVPTPIFGTVDITSTPAKADVLIDGKKVGQTPLRRDLIIGEHNIYIRKDGFNYEIRSIDIKEGAVEGLEVTLSKKVEQTTPKYHAGSYSSSSSAKYSENDTAEGKYCKVKFTTVNYPAYVYVDGEYKGRANSDIWLNYGTRYIVVKHNNICYGRSFDISDESDLVLEMVGAPKVASVNKIDSYGDGENGHYTSSYKKKYKKNKGGFNVGISFGAGYEILESAVELNAGILWRLWRHNSIFNVTTGASYMRTVGTNFVNIPFVINWNMVRSNSGSMYMGLGTEFSISFAEYNSYSRSLYFDFPIVYQWGLGWRHSDFSFYIKYYVGYELCTMGLRYAYLF